VQNLQKFEMDIVSADNKDPKAKVINFMDKTKAKGIRKMLDGYGLTISSLGYYPNPLHPDPEHRETVIAHLKKVVEAAAMLEVGVVGTFIGKDKNKTVPQNLEDYARVWPSIVKFAKEHGVKIAIENCPMMDRFRLRGENIAISPEVWDEMYRAVPSKALGIELDPSHMVWQGIDYIQAIYDYGDRIFHIHAKDMEINRRPVGSVGDYLRIAELADFHSTMALKKQWKERMPF
jgi:sugar phosphate isomerase/epimerase